MTPYTHDERSKTRLGFRRMEDLAGKAREAASRGLSLPASERAVVEAVTGTGDINRQIDALSSVSDRIRADHIDRLAPLAQGDFSAFCEVVNPSEPPESPWHIWLTNQLQAIETDPDLNKFVLNCPPGHAKPLSVDTLVLMASGAFKRLGDIRVGDMVVGHTGYGRKVTAVHDQGVLKLVRITTAQGRVILAEPSHPFLVEFRGKSRWVKAGELLTGQTVVVQPGHTRSYPAIPTSSAVDAANANRELDHECDILRMRGVMATGGALTYQKSNKPPFGTSPDLRISSARRETMLEVKRLAADLGAKMSVCAVRGQVTFVARPSVEDYRWLNEGDWFSLKPDQRRAPAAVHTASREEIAAFVGGALMMRAEVIRRIPGRNLRLRHRSEGLIRDLHRLCARLGARGDIELPDADFGGAYFLSFDQGGVDALHAAGVCLGPDLTARLEAQKPSGPRFKPAPLHLDAVVSVAPAGTGPCRCLSVEQDHSFTADLLVVSNSTYASRLFVSWRMGRDPDQRVIGGGHSQNFVENEFSKKIRDLVGSPEYQRVFPQVRISTDTRAAQQWGLAGRKGQYVARGVGQGIHGFRATFICVDDPYSKIEDAQSAVNRRKVEVWFDGDIGSRALPGCKIFLIMTRFHGEDLTHHLEVMNPLLPPALQWKIVTVPAICFDPDTDLLNRQLGEVLWSYYNHQYFIGKKIEFGFIGFALTYQQVSSAATPGNIASKFQYYDSLPHLEEAALKDCVLDSQGRPIPQRDKHIRRTVISVDTAAKTTERADYTVIQCWMQGRNGKHYLVDQDRGKWEMPDMISRIERMAIRHNAEVMLVEDKGQGTAYIQQRQPVGNKRLAPCPIEPINPGQQGKEFRLDAVATIIDAGDVYLPKEAPFIDGFLVEVGQFPGGAHDDQVDAMTQYLAYARSKTARYGSRKITSRG